MVDASACGDGMHMLKLTDIEQQLASTGLSQYLHTGLNTNHSAVSRALCLHQLYEAQPHC